MYTDDSSYNLGVYKLRKTLGHGSFAKVKLAEHEITGILVAVKIISRRKWKESAGQKASEMEEKVRRETFISRKLDHPHVVRLYDVIDSPTHLFLVMEYVSGGDLFDYIVQHGRSAEEDARRFFQQIIASIEYCHSKDVIHRDLKPENILLDEKRNVKLADFGLANVTKDGFFLRTACGSPNYAAPEVLSGRLYAGPEVDIWSSGVILYAILCGCLPFEDDNLTALIKRVKSGVFPMPNFISPAARDLIRKMLVVDPMTRITIPEIRQHPWFKRHLPVYLSIPLLPDELVRVELDPAALDEAADKLKISEKEVRAAVVGDYRTQTVVTYNLIADRNRRLNFGNLPRQMSTDYMEVDGSRVGNSPSARASPVCVEAATYRLSPLPIWGAQYQQEPHLATPGAAHATAINTSSGQTHSTPCSPVTGGKHAADTQGLYDARRNGIISPKSPASGYGSPVVAVPHPRVSALYPPGAGSSASPGANRASRATTAFRPPAPVSIPSEGVHAAAIGPHRPAPVAPFAAHGRQAPSQPPQPQTFVPIFRSASPSGPNTPPSGRQTPMDIEVPWGIESWRVGMHSSLPAAAVMKEILRVIHLLGFEWKVVGPYQLKCRQLSEDKMAPPLKMRFALFRTIDKRYVLDAQVLKGHTCVFLDACSRFIDELII